MFVMLALYHCKFCCLAWNTHDSPFSRFCFHHLTFKGTVLYLYRDKKGAQQRIIFILLEVYLTSPMDSCKNKKLSLLSRVWPAWKVLQQLISVPRRFQFSSSLKKEFHKELNCKAGTDIIRSTVCVGEHTKKQFIFGKSEKLYTQRIVDILMRCTIRQLRLLIWGQSSGN